jgi:hypothetical protein
MIMKSLGRLFLAFWLTTAALPALAQEDPPVLPTEIFVCNFVGDSDMDDLNRAFNTFNAWADRQGIEDLSIFLLTPNFYSDELEFDVLGLNIWPTGAAFGGGNQKISADPNSIAAFEGVVDCNGHSWNALVGVKPPTVHVANDGLFEFSDCTLHGNRSNDEGIAAVVGASLVFDKWNLNDAHGVLFNISGGPAELNYQFKWITYYPSYETLGTLFDHMVNDGGLQALGALIEPVMQCNSSRIYSTTVMRTAVEEL